MNSLNILSAISSTPPHTSRSESPPAAPPAPRQPKAIPGAGDNTLLQGADQSAQEENRSNELGDGMALNEKELVCSNEQTPLLGGLQSEQLADFNSATSWRSFPSRICSAVFGAVKAVAVWITAPGRYLFAYFFDADGRFSPLLPVVAISRALMPGRRKRVPRGNGVSADSTKNHLNVAPSTGPKQAPRESALEAEPMPGTGSLQSSRYAGEARNREQDAPSKQRRFKSSPSQSSEESAPSRRSIRIKLHNEDASKRRIAQLEETKSRSSKEADAKELVAASLKSPSGPNSMKITRFPKAPLPPRPLVLRRQPSYSKVLHSGPPPQKTLVIDLDETLIHSHSKGGRFATGHMVEVKMSHAVGVNGVTIAPQVPILYYVHKRPHCDEFLRKVHKWFRLVVFTASVQEYADPVIDWLEMERPYFDARYYRQHCTMRNGAYIKDLSQVEPDLSKVMILDNSPVSYIFHEDNAIPIEGWISDPTDNDLLHLVPLLEGLQYVTDVRALLALRLGQPRSEAT